MTPEFDATSQLEKIDMLDFTDLVAINKYDRKGDDAALHDVRKQLQRNKQAFALSTDEMSVYGTIASKFNDNGVITLYQLLVQNLQSKGLEKFDPALADVPTKVSTEKTIIIPPAKPKISS